MTGFARQMWGLAVLALLSGALPSPLVGAVGSDLCDAAIAGDLRRINTLLAAHAEVNAAADDGATALMLAAQNGHLEVVQALLAARAAVNATAATAPPH